ncbi:hypothetical protein GCM10009759_08480 [Kitasatospora saccharophila]|uniref:DCC family thiol-disulfide oxidoreductase YuxK n=1 Tax=Kitasatospora saccharophila TaxID=407973 RepID=A0ABN2W9J4_9ACTN
MIGDTLVYLRRSCPEAHVWVIDDARPAPDGGWRSLLLYAAIGQFVVRGPIYRRKWEPGTGFWRSVAWGLTYPAYLLSRYVVSWRAVGRMTSGRNGWAKTRRNAETAAGPVAKEA